MFLETVRSLAWLDRIWGHLGSMAGEVAVAAKGSECRKRGCTVSCNKKSDHAKGLFSAYSVQCISQMLVFNSHRYGD